MYEYITVALGNHKPYSKWITLLSLSKYNLTIEIVNHPVVNYFEIAEAPVFR